jgi:hypothetical protein
MHTSHEKADDRYNHPVVNLAVPDHLTMPEQDEEP